MIEVGDLVIMCPMHSIYRGSHFFDYGSHVTCDLIALPKLSLDTDIVNLCNLGFRYLSAVGSAGAPSAI